MDGKPVPDKLLAVVMSTMPRPGSRWLHTKTGHVYVVVTSCLAESDLDPTVVYRRDGEGPESIVVWSRPLSSWKSTVIVDTGTGVPAALARFVLLKGDE